MRAKEEIMARDLIIKNSEKQIQDLQSLFNFYFLN
jgi:hypothetical protein